jgi:hypothetical protein
LTVVPVTVLDPLPNESYDLYVARLRAAGLVGEITKTELSAEELDPQLAAGGVIRTNPGRGTRISPDDELEVFVNPAAAGSPLTGGGGGPGTDPASDGTDASLEVCKPATIRGPTVHVPAGGADLFPIGFLYFIKDWLSSLVTDPVAPKFTLVVPGTSGIHVDLGRYDSWWLGTVRPVVIAISAVLMLVSIVRLLGNYAIREQAQTTALTMAERKITG